MFPTDCQGIGPGDMSPEKLLGLQEKGTHESSGRKLANTIWREGDHYRYANR